LRSTKKTRKKKDADLVREDLKPRLPDDLLCTIVKARMESPACMNKGFILDGFPRSLANAQAVFYDAIPDFEVEDEEGKDPLEGK